ncbi:UNVERIFIED_CONTAM: hypothetical protein PYX00_004902 [Menopon gallinae]|uniref:Uncharacterized protein n=1 Tax=Menopon gallinae TaxID=328185 RepID=A0AAW2I774_9NEOP
MIYFLNSGCCSIIRNSSKEILGFLYKHNASSSIRTLKTCRNINVQSVLQGRTSTQNLILKSNVRYNTQKSSEKPSDRFERKDKTETLNLWGKVTLVISVTALCAGIVYFLKKEKLRAQEIERSKALGKTAIGGSFELVDSNNKIVKSEELHGNWLLIYFGFTHCPDICPDEMEKLVKAVEKIENDKKLPKVIPVFITVDPERDTPSVIGKYVKEFSDKIIALTGTTEQIKEVCKKFRVYYSPGKKNRDSDYIVDHSIITYLMNPEGEFIDYYGVNISAEQMYKSFKVNVTKYNALKSTNPLAVLFS